MHRSQISKSWTRLGNEHPRTEGSGYRNKAKKFHLLDRTFSGFHRPEHPEKANCATIRTKEHEVQYNQWFAPQTRKSKTSIEWKIRALEEFLLSPKGTSIYVFK
jgi:hypothetical protein